MPFDVTLLDAPTMNANRLKLIEGLERLQALENFVDSENGFEWDFRQYLAYGPTPHNCATAGCAMGYGKYILPEIDWDHDLPLGKALGFVGDDYDVRAEVDRTFYNISSPYEVEDKLDITPGMVAARLRSLPSTE